MNKLTVTADREDYSVGLTGSLQLDGFSGFGEGWFNNSEVKEFCSSIQNLSNNMSGAAELIGSQSKANGDEYLERFSLRCYVLSKSKVNYKSDAKFIIPKIWFDMKKSDSFLSKFCSHQ